ncbi:TraC family protein [Pseudoalteromonas marina]|uniref:TraC family protein n=2 Tax=Bacteria TaxID=2 RepID=A0ABT9FCL9_9GAMM|nr:TraC family protein [Pseudoalteromonas marina]MDP2564380.1 TraC family protein [Pseudoalteromonas marina]
MDYKLIYRQQANKLRRFLFSNQSTGKSPTTLAMANALLERNNFESLLPYRDFHEESNLVFTDNGTTPYAGFAFEINPLLLAGADTEEQIDSLLQKLPANSTAQFTCFSSPEVSYYLNSWAQGRAGETTDPLLMNLTVRRRDYMIQAANKFSLLPTEDLRPRIYRFNIIINIPFTGDYTSLKELEIWIKIVSELQTSLKGTLKSIGLQPEVLNEKQNRGLIKALINPQYKETFMNKEDRDNDCFGENLVEKGSRIYVTEEGDIRFSKAGDKKKTSVACLTMDTYPSHIQLYQMASLIGAPKDLKERISMPFYMYTNIHILDIDKATEDLTTTLAILNKQTMSESQWYRSMMQHLFTRVNDTRQILQMARDGKTIVRMYTGINIYSDEENTKLDSEYVAGLWRKHKFKVSRESFISLPIFINSLPYGYDALRDQKKSGIQRAITCTSYNAATAIPIQGDWMGTNPAQGGPLFISRRGSLASIDLFSTPTNYNFCTIATSGAGKSYLNQEFVIDILTRGGIVRVFDQGGSYARLCEILGGENMVFDTSNAKSLNCFWGLDTEKKFKHFLPYLKEIAKLMAYPIHDIPPFEYGVLEDCIVSCWHIYRERLETHHLYEWLIEEGNRVNDRRYNDLALQIKSHAIGRYKEWFNGPRELEFTNRFTIIELNELENDNELKTLVLTLAVNEIANEFYGGPREVVKMCLIDEGWSLLANKGTTGFIERLFRTARKYNATVGLITQSYNDFNVNPAAKSALENSAWRFNLYQKPDSIQAAMEANKLPTDPFFLDLVKSVAPGEGYSEVFVDCELGKSVFRFTVDPHTHYTYTTNPKDINKLGALIKQGFTTESSIDALAVEILKNKGMTIVD